MKFFKNLKESILGSIKEDLNSALGGKQALFNSKIAGALDDLIAMKTGINISNIPSKITQEAALASEARRKKIKNPDEAVNEDGSRITPSSRALLRFPTSNDRLLAIQSSFLGAWMLKFSNCNTKLSFNSPLAIGPTTFAMFLASSSNLSNKSRNLSAKPKSSL